MRKTKIICTLGPASTDETTIEAMLKNGMNVARLNFSHGSHEDHKKTIEMFRKVRDKLGMPAAIMLDTKGPEIRIRDIENGAVELITGEKVTLTTKDVLGTSKLISITYEDLPSQLERGNRILVDDGKIMLTVLECNDTDILCSIDDGGTLRSKKGINVPYIHLNMPYISKRDENDIRFGIENDVDFIAASFVRCKEDVIELRNFVNYYGGHDIKIISKIENNEGVENFDEILKHSDGIMVARGDMGVEVDYERLPGIQKKFIKKCYSEGKIVITATQMLDSMITNATPTRAEITDVANAVFDGTSALMLSGETAMGAHPARVVSVMAKIAQQAELDSFEMNNFSTVKYSNDIKNITNAICDAAATTANDIKAKAIIAVTKSGQTARLMSKFRPSEIIVGATPELKTYHQLSMSWGVFPVLALNQDSADSLFIHSVDCAKKNGYVSEGDSVVITAGVPISIAGTTNILKVQIV